MGGSAGLAVTSDIRLHVRLPAPHGVAGGAGAVKLQVGLSRPRMGRCRRCWVTDAVQDVGWLVACGDSLGRGCSVCLPAALADGLDVSGQPG